jgi:sterol desaturase/sphingolipid hydroxylase (fatty acid hydroxylase superfamily)
MQELINAVEQTQVLVAVIGLIILFLIESVHPFFDFFKGSFKKRGIHFLANVSLGVVNALMNAVIFVGLWLWASTWADASNFGLLNWIESSFPVMAGWPRVIVAVLLFDIWMYAWHRMNHEIPFLWRFHRVHHSDPNMDVSTSTRFHTGEILFSSILRIPIILLLGLYLWELFIYGILVAIVVQFHHANINLPGKMDNILRWFIVTPHMHKVHHSRWQPETDSNYSTIFSFWDRIWKTFRLRDPLNTLKLGLDEFDSEEDQQIKGLFSMPFRNKKGNEK